VRNDDGCQLDLFHRQIADKLFFSDGMAERSEAYLSTETLPVGLVALEDIFLFKSVAGRPDDIGDMTTLVQTRLDFEIIEQEIERQVALVGGEQFATIISGSLEDLDEQEGIQTPLDDVVPEYYNRYVRGLELRLELDTETPKLVSELAAALDISAAEVEERFEYLSEFGFAERAEEGLIDTGHRDEFNRT
jgi:hypothetical protein